MPTLHVHVGILKNVFQHFFAFQIKLKFASVGFWGEGKNWATPWPRKLPSARKRTKNKLNQHVASPPGFKPWGHFGGRWVLPPLHQPCLPWWFGTYMYLLFQCAYYIKCFVVYRTWTLKDICYTLSLPPMNNHLDYVSYHVFVLLKYDMAPRCVWVIQDQKYML